MKRHEFKTGDILRHTYFGQGVVREVSAKNGQVVIKFEQEPEPIPFLIAELLDSGLISLPEDIRQSGPGVPGRSFGHFYVAGTAFENRSAIIRNLKVGDRLYLLPEPNNEYDYKAVQVLAPDGQPIGYIPRKINLEFFTNICSGAGHYLATVYELGIRDTDNSYNVGVEYIFEPSPDNEKDRD